MNLPTEQQCLNFFKQYKVPQNILRHCQKVRQVAVFLAKKLREKGVALNVDLVDRTALLHDLLKMVSIKDPTANKYHQDYKLSAEELAMWKQLREKYKDMYEGQVAYEIFKDNYPELALTLKRASDPRNRTQTWEELVVHYADWRVFKDKVVSLQERLIYLREAYPREEAVWQEYSQFMFQQEQKLMKTIKMNPEELAKAVP